MESKVILVTGGSSGVGRMIVETLSFSNNNIVITLARRVDRLKEYFSNRENVFCYGVDLSNLSDVYSAMDQISKKHGAVSYIINCAGVMKAGMVEESSVEDLNYSICVNAYAPIEIIKYFLPKMKEQNFGRVINLTSGAPLNCFPNYSAYSVSKGVLNALTVTLAKELNTFNIKINLMSPGPVRSEMAPDAPMEPEVCLPTLKYLMDESTESGCFFWLGYKIPLSPDLGNIDWLRGKGSDKTIKVL